MKNKTIAMRIACINELEDTLRLKLEPPARAHIVNVITRLKKGEA
jgi:hypothetical protein